jgi:hypothetical protein
MFLKDSSLHSTFSLAKLTGECLLAHHRFRDFHTNSIQFPISATASGILAALGTGLVKDDLADIKE